MKNLIKTGGLLFLAMVVVLPARGKDPKADIAARFSYFRAGISNGTNLFGWLVDVSGNPTNHLGIIADFGGQ